MPPIKAIRAGLPTLQIFAANTGVGKTIFSTALCRAAVRAPLSDLEKRRGKGADSADGNPIRKVFYLKPVQTGYPKDSDARHVQSYCPEAHARVLFTYEEPAGAHLTAVRENRMVTDQELLDATQLACDGAYRAAGGDPAMMLLETAGGVNSPVMSGTLQADAYRAFRHPTILIGDGNLGGVSTTLSAYESLILRGYDIVSILMFHSDKYLNHEAVQRNVDAGVTVYTFDFPPPMPQPQMLQEPSRHELMLDYTNMLLYYEKVDGVAGTVVAEALNKHEKRIEKLEGLGKQGESKLWWPFTQHQLVKNPTVIDSAYGDYYTTYTPGSSTECTVDSTAPAEGISKTQYDACASWWTQGLGHGNPRLSLATASAAGRYGHVIFPECVHEPAVDLADKLLASVGKGWASRVFYSDDGSTATEVALKAALRRAELDLALWRTDKGVVGPREGNKEVLEIIGIEGSYHGDTIGAMDASDPNVYNGKINWYSGRGLWFQPPTIVMKDGTYTLRIPESISIASETHTFETLDSLFSPDRDTSALATAYRSHITTTLQKAASQNRTFGALILEPILMGAGGMLFVDPLFQRTLINTVRSSPHHPPLPVIFDEVFVGLFRLGPSSPGVSWLGVTPDVACYAKSLTGGVVPLAATVVSERVFQAFVGDTKEDALLHGHSYSAHPVGCTVAVRALEEYERMGLGKKEVGFVWDEELVRQLSSLANVNWVVALGSVLAFEPQGTDTTPSRTAQSIVTYLRSTLFPSLASSIYARPLGGVVYIMASHVTSEKDAKGIMEALLDAVEKAREGAGAGEAACVV